MTHYLTSISTGFMLLVLLGAGCSSEDSADGGEKSAGGASSGGASSGGASSGGASSGGSAGVAGSKQVTGFEPVARFSVEGTVGHGHDLTISDTQGSLFGDRAQAAPILWDFGDEVYENGVLNLVHQQYTDAAAVPTISGKGTTQNDNAIWNDQVSAAQPTHPLRFEIALNPRHSRVKRHYKADYPMDGHVSVPKAQADAKKSSSVRNRWYLSFWYMHDPVNDYHAAGNKFFRWGRQKPGDMFFIVGPDNGTSAIRDFSSGEGFQRNELADAEGNPFKPYQHSDIYPFRAGDWALWEFVLVKRQDGKWAARYGVQNFKYHAYNWGAAEGAGTKPTWQLSVFGYDGTLSNTGQKVPRFGEVYFDNDDRQFVIADAATLKDATIVEIQRPTEWKANTVSVNQYQGAFDSLAGLYLFYREADSEGYWVTTRVGQFL